MTGNKCRQCNRPALERLVGGLCRSCLLHSQLCTTCGEPVDLFTLCGYIEPSSICIECREAEREIVSGAS